MRCPYYTNLIFSDTKNNDKTRIELAFPSFEKYNRFGSQPQNKQPIQIGFDYSSLSIFWSG